MKCEHCGKNEVSFVYRSNINGKITEKHLCNQCAEEQGYSQKIAVHNQRMMENFFGNRLFGDFFYPVPSLLGRRGWMLEDPFDDFFRDMPALGEKAEPEAPKPQKQDTLVEPAEQSRFARMRKLNALRIEMKQAAHREDFERAAQLRDEIRVLEKEQTEAGESA